MLALSEHNWPADPGEALITQKWSPNIELRREFRVFCFDGRVTAISQHIWWEKMGWRENFSSGFVEAILLLWENVKGRVPFDNCTMDVLMTTKDINSVHPWKAELIEFNGFGTLSIRVVICFTGPMIMISSTESDQGSLFVLLTTGRKPKLQTQSNLRPRWK